MIEPKRPKDACVDCWERSKSAIMAVGSMPPPSWWRPSPFPGPRCATDHRKKRSETKAKAQQRRDAAVYGLAEGGYEALLEIQGGVCALCRTSKGVSKRMPVDHDHATGAVRGICCSNCNRNVLGWFAHDDPEAFRRGMEYLLDPPASQLDPRFILPKGAQE